MVLALGAQIKGGDGDAHCPKEVARAWSKHLADQAHSLLTNSRENGVVDAIRLWLLYTVYLGNYGQIDGMYCPLILHLFGLNTIYSGRTICSSGTRCSPRYQPGPASRAHLQSQRVPGRWLTGIVLDDLHCGKDNQFVARSAKLSEYFTGDRHCSAASWRCKSSLGRYISQT